MPYIKQKRRKELEMILEEFIDKNITKAGDINYLITSILVKYMNLRGGPNYAIINEIMGVLECAKLEFYRKVAAPYENSKCKENGEVY